MRFSTRFVFGLCLAGIVACGGCASSPKRPVAGLEIETARVVPVSFETAWLATRDVLRENDYIIETRDKRGVFVAYAEQKRRLRRRKRNELRIMLEAVSSTSTRVRVEVQVQKYGVTPLTYPGWHDQKTTDGGVADAFLDALESQLRNRSDA